MFAALRAPGRPVSGLVADGGLRRAPIEPVLGSGLRCGRVGVSDPKLGGRLARVSTSTASSSTARQDVDLFRDAYIGEFVEFTDAVREGRAPSVTGADASRALRIALACIESCRAHVPVKVAP